MSLQCLTRHIDYLKRNVKIFWKTKCIACNLRMELIVRSGPEKGERWAPCWAAGISLLLVLQIKTSAWVKIRRPHFSWDQGDLQDHTCTEKIPGGQERERLLAHYTFCQPPQNLHNGIQIGWKVCVYIREGPESDQIWATSKMIGQKGPRRWPPYNQLKPP